MRAPPAGAAGGAAAKAAWSSASSSSAGGTNSMAPPPSRTPKALRQQRGGSGGSGGSSRRPPLSSSSSSSNHPLAHFNGRAGGSEALDLRACCCALLGRVFDKRDKATKAVCWLTLALRVDPYCADAFECLASRHLLSAAEEQTLLGELPGGPLTTTGCARSMRRA